MNLWTQRSVEIANQRNYLDLLFKVYPLSSGLIREVNPVLWQSVERAFTNKDNEALIKSLIALDLFPIKDSYVPYLRRDPSAIARNPETINRLAGSLYEMGLEQIWDKATQPKETNRQIGPLFKRWIDSGTIGVPVFTSAAEFMAFEGNCILSGPDSLLKQFAHSHLNYNLDKGLDFIGKFNGKFIIGEAKFLTDFGGHQDRQFDDAMRLVNYNESSAITVAILDGVVYIPSPRARTFRLISESDGNIMSSLVLRDFLYQV